MLPSNKTHVAMLHYTTNYLHMKYVSELVLLLRTSQVRSGWWLRTKGIVWWIKLLNKINLEWQIAPLIEKNLSMSVIKPQKEVYAGVIDIQKYEEHAEGDAHLHLLHWKWMMQRILHSIVPFTFVKSAQAQPALPSIHAPPLALDSISQLLLLSN